jgi:hypothetical protein
VGVPGGRVPDQLGNVLGGRQPAHGVARFVRRWGDGDGQAVGKGVLARRHDPEVPDRRPRPGDVVTAAVLTVLAVDRVTGAIRPVLAEALDRPRLLAVGTPAMSIRQGGA